jgi:Phage tail tube protein, TTP
MGKIYKNSGLRMALQSAIGAAKTISAATNAAPGVFSSAAHGFANGDIVLLEVQGMVEVNNRLFQVMGVAAGTFILEGVDGVTGVDTTSYGTFTSGTAKLVTLGTSVTGVSGFSPTGGDIKFLDTTTVHDTDDKQITAGSTALSYNLTMQWDPADVAQAAMLATSRLGEPKAFRILWPNNVYAMFYGTVGYSGAPGGDNQGVTTSNAAVALSGSATYGVN